jgi:methionyl-tRNA formyltransferase
MSSMRLIFAGSGAFGLPALRLLAGDVAQVVSQPDRPAGRGRKTAPTPIAQFALDQGIPLLRTSNINQEKLADADAMVVIAFGQKISQAQANRPRLGSVNLHGSLLPKCRGAAPVAWTILRGETVTGNTVIRLAERMDAGAILGQDRVEISPAETAGELHDRLAAAGAELVKKVLDDLAAGRAVENRQDESSATTAPKLTRGDAMIDWTATADTAARRICAMWPWPPCHVQLLDAAGGEIVRLSLARARAAASEGPRWHAGEIETTGFIRAGDGAAVEVLQVQPEGRRVMTLEEFRCGHPWMAGMRLVSVAR